jgi:hypothetical protein
MLYMLIKIAEIIFYSIITFACELDLMITRIVPCNVWVTKNYFV